jgi:hypothetical protein
MTMSTNDVSITAPGTASAPEERMDAPDDNEIVSAPSYLRLVHVRFGKQERALLLGANGENWTPLPEWNQPKNKPTLSRAIHKLIHLGLIESDYDYAPGQRSATRRDRWDGSEQNYNIYYDRTRMLKLTPLGAAVVDQFRDALASGKRIRWFRTAPILSPEQEELQRVRDLVACSELGLKRFGDWSERFRIFDMPVLFSHLQSTLEAMRRDVGEWQKRIAELEADGVTLPPILAADAIERREVIWADLCSRVHAVHERFRFSDFN